ncbi:hypothetical protein VTJ83DRAFT_2078 [Remersonia thermophila]|uniref:Alcohol acetyltransferase n=1 Tax=Remersonia thermophila TaxID=72144 RepID=A0ABR4DK07_9PEZI
MFRGHRQDHHPPLVDTSSPSEVIRPLGPCEIYSSSRHALGFYKCVANTCQYSVLRTKLGDRGLHDILETAVANVILATPSLAVGIVGQDGSHPHFVRLPSIRTEHHIELINTSRRDTNDSMLLRTLERLHDQPWPEIEQRPPWKLTIILDNQLSEDEMLVFDAIFTAHHAIVDGRSTSEFHTRLLNELNGPLTPPSELTNGTLNMARPHDFPPTLEQLIAFSTSWGFLARTLFRELGPKWLQSGESGSIWTGAAVTPEPCRTRLRLVIIPAASVPAVLGACRRHNTTLTALLHALILLSLSKNLKPDQAPAFQSSTPIDLRPFVKGHSQSGGTESLFGVYVTAQTHCYKSDVVAQLRDRPSAAEVWTIAATLRKSIRQHLDNIPRDDIMSMLGWVTDWKKFWLSKGGKPRQDTWEVSNIGSMSPSHEESDEPEQRGWKIQRSIMSQSAMVAGAAIGISVSGVTGCGINLALGWQEGIVEEVIVDALTSDLQTWLDHVGHRDDDFINCSNDAVAGN